MAVVRRRLLGLAMIAVIVGLLGLSVAAYNQAFTPVTLVTLRTDRTGNQLAVRSDVKLRGIIVGSVRAISATAAGATVTLALDPARTAMIPANVSAQLLPKTLFGERYVALMLPSAPSAPIRAGDVIPQDRSATSIAFEKVLNDVLPLLQAVRPADLNATLTALATALDGRGAQLGRNLSALNAYLVALNPHAHTLVSDLAELGSVSSLFNRVAPDLLGTLANLQTTARTVTAQAAGLDALLQGGTGTADQLSGFFAANGQRIISVAANSLPLLQALAQYAPEYPCLAAGLATSEPRFEQMFGGQPSGPKALHITLQVVTPRGDYTPADAPAFGPPPGPTCQGLPNPQTPYPATGYSQGREVDGTTQNGSGAPAAPLPSVNRAALSAAAAAALDTVGSGVETRAIDALISGSYGAAPGQVPPVATLLAGPLLRGAQVSVR